MRHVTHRLRYLNTVPSWWCCLGNYGIFGRWSLAEELCPWEAAVSLLLEYVNSQLSASAICCHVCFHYGFPSEILSQQQRSN